MAAERAANDWAQTALDAVRDAIFAIDPEGCVSFENRAAERLTGVGLDAARHRRLRDILKLRDPSTGEALELEVPRNGKSGTTLIRPAVLICPDGAERRLDAHLDPVRTEEGALSGAAVLVLRETPNSEGSDADLRRRADEMVAADRRKDQFLAMLAHELRNPLAPIRNAVELMRQVETADPSFRPSREMVERQVKHLARLLDDLLDVSRLNQGSFRLRREPVDLGAAVERAVDANRPLIDSRGHTLTLDLPAPAIHLEADPARLEQVISNLVNNAAKYTMPGGRIWVRAERQGDEAVIRVRDNGIGVPPDVLGRVFEPFVQSPDSFARPEGGLGIGLSLVRSLVEMHGGTVEAHSAGLGQGSELIVRLPIRPAAGAPAGAPPPAQESQRSRETGPFARPRPVRVLVVEDNVDAAESLATLLRMWGHDVRVVHDGRDAIDAARIYEPEVVLLDIGLPGLDGYQVAERLRRDVGLDRALLVAMTGYGQPEDRRRSREAGIQHHFVKPVEPFVLRDLLAEVASPAGAS